MPEWSIGAVSKTVVPLREPRVRIPVFPLTIRLKLAENQRVSFVLRGFKIGLVPQTSPPLNWIVFNIFYLYSWLMAPTSRRYQRRLRFR